MPQTVNLVYAGDGEDQCAILGQDIGISVAHAMAGKA